jgi:DNA-binding transcriptional ArsR family regulator
MSISHKKFKNPFKPGAGHMPPYLAGREDEVAVFKELLGQETILKNLVLTGLRGVGKTVLLETLKPIAVKAGWVWVGTDMSEQASLTEDRMATRLLTDLATWTTSYRLQHSERTPVLSMPERIVETPLGYSYLRTVYETTNGLTTDKLKAVFEHVWQTISKVATIPGVIFAYDEAQTMFDDADGSQYPLSMLLDLFQSIQKKGIPFMLVLTGLPTLFPKLVASRTYAERMFRVVFLDHLNESETRKAILLPIKKERAELRITDQSIARVYEFSGGYPYFIQFICRELYDIAIRGYEQGQHTGFMETFTTIIQKLDCDFFAGRWARTTDRQRDLFSVIAAIEHCESEFTVKEIVEKSKEHLDKGFSASHASQILQSLTEAGLVYKNRHGKYAFAVPMFRGFIQRQLSSAG